MTDPWFEAFRRAPDQAVAALFSGRQGVGSNMRLDVPELLYQSFPPNLNDERAQLDQALLSWLLGMRGDYAFQVKRLGFPVYGKRVGDALIALQLLELPESRSCIRADMSAWLRWLLPLRLAPERDPALECYRLLTRGQPDTGHLAMWLRLAADPRPEYLTVALAGLQLLPNHDNAQENQMLMLRALLRHAVTTRHDANAARTVFNGAFSALRGLFPRSPEHWKRVLNEALDGFLQQTPGRVAKELTDALRTTWLDKPDRLASTRKPVPVKQEEWADLRADILYSNDQPERLSHRLFEAEHWAEQASRHERDAGHPDSRTVWQPVDWMRADVYLGDADLVHDDRDTEIREAVGGDRPTPLPDAMPELSRRGRLAGEFTRALIVRARGRVAPTDLIRQEAMKGDSLAGFYSQWLIPEETPECPPHAWAWSACRHWQESASPDEWRHLATRFPEAVPETEFLRILARPHGEDQSGAAGWRSRYCSDDGTGSRAIDVFMREAQKRIASAGQPEREELAVEVMACAAADAPEFALEWAA